MMLERLLPFYGLVLCSVFASAQEAYTIGHYLRDRTISARVDSAYTAGDPQRALELHRMIQNRSPDHLYWRARLSWEIGQPYIPLLRSAFAADYLFEPDTTDALHVANMDLLRQLYQEQKVRQDRARIHRCLNLMDVDQRLASGAFWDSLAHRNTVDTLDALIKEGGWPSSYPLGGTGVAIVLAHQHWDDAYFFEPYQQLMEEECRAGREDWTVALSTLQQRIRWTARNKTDTIMFSDLTLRDQDPALPMVVAISERMAVNGHKHVWIHAQDSTIANAIADRLIAVQPTDTTPPEVLEMLKAMHFDHPTPLTLERITFVIEPQLGTKKFLYRMD